MSAQQLTKEWVDGFIELMKDASVDGEDNTIAHAVRAIARDESLGNPTLLKKLNPTEILVRAQAAEEERRQALQTQLKQEKDALAEETAQRTRLEERADFDSVKLQRSDFLASKIVKFLELAVALICVVILVLGWGAVDPSRPITWLQSVLFVLVTAVACLDLFQFRPVARLTEPLRLKLSGLLYRLLYGGPPSG